MVVEVAMCGGANLAVLMVFEHVLLMLATFRLHKFPMRGLRN